MENAKRRGVPGEVSLLLAAVIWGGAFVAQSLGGDSLGPLSFNASRSLIGALALVPVILWNDRKQGTGRPKGRERRLLWLGGALCGICLTLAVNLQQVAIAWVDVSGRANVGKIGFLTAMYIVLVPILSLFLKKRVGANVYAGILLALAGMYLLCVKEGFALGGGDVYALLAALMFALQIIVIDIFAPKVDNIRLSALQFLVCGALSGALALGTETQSARAYRDALLPILYTGVLSSGVGYTLQILGQRRCRPQMASLLMSMESVFSAIFGFLILHQKMTGRELIGCVLMLAAVLLAQWKPRGERNANESV